MSDSPTFTIEVSINSITAAAMTVTVMMNLRKPISAMAAPLYSSTLTVTSALTPGRSTRPSGAGSTAIRTGTRWVTLT